MFGFKLASLNTDSKYPSVSLEHNADLLIFIVEKNLTWPEFVKIKQNLLQGKHRNISVLLYICFSKCQQNVKLITNGINIHSQLNNKSNIFYIAFLMPKYLENADHANLKLYL